MIQRTLREVEKMAGGFGLKKEYEEILIKGVSTDSRTITANQLFIPIKGVHFDGHKFIEKAVRDGAAAALWNKDTPLPEMDFPIIFVEDTLTAIQKLAKEYRMQLPMKVIGITGSNGKTSTKDILAGLLKTKYKTHKTFGNLNNHLGVPLTILEIAEGTEMAVIEMGMSELGEIELLTSIALPDAAIITNIGEAHLTTLKTKENIYQAKLEILRGLKEHGLFVYFGDDGILKGKIEDMNLDQKITTFGQDSSNNYRPAITEIREDGISFKLNGMDHHTFLLPMLGKHQMYNAVAAIAVARYFNVSFDLIKEGLLEVDATGMRNELIHTPKYTILNDSYKSNPTSLRAALETLYGLKDYQQKIAVLGDMEGIGEEEVAFHKEIGAQIDPNQIDYLFTIGPLASYIAKMAAPRFPQNKVVSCKNKKHLIVQIVKVLQKGSIILVKASRGFELEEVVDALRKEGENTKETKKYA
ncbi:UDP-N-acetylmuramoyl-tripeptide--D-alanyl-D-alanine ligase [Geosporobacter ferrireducens]|uniref:UDP-N-acetylmuramoyl-tripeptide--D-alanyl-D-alanine ligase n=1 Tax=Geosporobacter ferrireducens TaxID=1424294 RepID=A0A1D8GCJ8_9FIRM|nr:UDP-N-acetylmuramoyl-tripeptide--D-alanyl-D-alanine ligase [Geosporobacter ferrireducens]AOT68634.1 UDP-N-acetylmuramoyl-tripeptide--D-alanyl-D-alanine ligase [Geosporobacter ferrireducens]MTI54106.1 UDP-N-acetylmuramoyl-tripeptide--D-alanyl-D-alanine ligase [Geosporobacter ferrireducens]